MAFVAGLGVHFTTISDTEGREKIEVIGRVICKPCSHLVPDYESRLLGLGISQHSRSKAPLISIYLDSAQQNTHRGPFTRRREVVDPV